MDRLAPLRMNLVPEQKVVQTLHQTLEQQPIRLAAMHWFCRKPASLSKYKARAKGACQDNLQVRILHSWSKSHQLVHNHGELLVVGLSVRGASLSMGDPELKAENSSLLLTCFVQFSMRINLQFELSKTLETWAAWDQPCFAQLWLFEDLQSCPATAGHHANGRKRQSRTAPDSKASGTDQVMRRDIHGRKIVQEPVNNRRLKQERVQSKRVSRAAHQGLSLGKINQQLHDFVQQEGDIEVGAISSLIWHNIRPDSMDLQCSLGYYFAAFIRFWSFTRGEPHELDRGKKQ